MHEELSIAELCTQPDLPTAPTHDSFPQPPDLVSSHQHSNEHEGVVRDAVVARPAAHGHDDVVHVSTPDPPRHPRLSDAEIPSASHGCRNPVDVAADATAHATAAMQGLAYDIAQERNIDWTAALAAQLQLIGSMEDSFFFISFESKMYLCMPSLFAVRVKDLRSPWKCSQGVRN